MWLLLAGEGGLIGSSSLRDPIEKKMYPKLSHMYIAGYMYLYRVLISFVSTKILKTPLFQNNKFMFPYTGLNFTYFALKPL